MSQQPVYNPNQPWPQYVHGNTGQPQQYPMQPGSYMQAGPVFPQVQPQRRTQVQPGYSYSMKKQSVKVHLILFLFTAGIGNVFYAMACRSKAAARYKW